MENNQTQNNQTNIVPLWEKYTLTIREAAEYFNIGEKRLRSIVYSNPNADFVVMNGNRAMIKRKIFELYIDKATAV
ncbi:MAG: transposase [Lachnospiraceae bacterium]|nr:transposase [Lachnospiraceae bacterium]